MRKISFYTYAFVGALTVIGCQKSIDTVIATGDMASGIISAVISEEDSKTSLEPYGSEGKSHVNWSTGDQIAVISDYDYNLRTYTLTSGAGTTSASFSADVQAIGGTDGTVYAAYYPASAVRMHGNQSGGVRTGLWYPGTDVDGPWLYEQTYYPGRPDPDAMFMRARGTDLSNMSFKNMTSVIKISVYDNRGASAATISSIKLSADTHELARPKYFDYRNYSIDPNQFQNSYQSIAGTFNNYVVLRDINVKLTSTPTDFYIVVNGGASINSMTVELINARGNSQSKTKVSSFTTVAGHQYSLPAFECTLPAPSATDGLYYKADGAAEWTKWVSGVPSFSTSLTLKTQAAVLTDAFIADLASAIAGKSNAVTVDMSQCDIDPITRTFPASFRNNKKINTISLPGNTLVISDYAFNNSSLEFVTLPDGLKTIGNYSFMSSKLNQINVPASVEKIGWFNLWYCPSSVGWVVDSSNQDFSSEDGLLYNQTKTKLIEIPTGKVTGSSYTVRSGVEVIGAYAFCSKHNLEMLTLPSSVNSIGNPCFSGCLNLSSLTIENTANTVTIASGTFSSNTGQNASTREILVPVTMIASYKTDSNWSALENRTSYPYAIKPINGTESQTGAVINPVDNELIYTF